MRHFHWFAELYYLLLGAAALWLVVSYFQPASQLTNTAPPARTEDFDLSDLLPDFRDFVAPPPRLRPVPPEHVAALIDSIYTQTQVTQYYDPAYVKLSYPGGDVAPERGVCTDVIVRAFREQGVDLQQQVHQDMRQHFRKYPQKWGLRRPDRNIDHRRVANLMTFFNRQGVALPVSDNPDDYLPGDVVAWQLNDKQQHIGMVMQARSNDSQRPLIGHNISSGTHIQDVLFAWEIIGHYRYFPQPVQQTIAAPTPVTTPELN